MNPRKQLLEAAWDATSKFRGSSPQPENSFQNIANLWSAYLGEVINPEDVALMMVLLKVARLMEDATHYDSAVDIAGYAACLQEIVHKQEMEDDGYIESVRRIHEWLNTRWQDGAQHGI